MSHSSEDKTIARIVKKILENAGHRVWLDENDLRYGAELLTSIRLGIEDSSDFIYLCSKASSSSIYVSEELYLARKRHEEHKLKVHVMKLTQEAKLPLWLQDRLYLDLNGENLRSRANKYFYDTTGTVPNDLIIEELLSYLSRNDDGTFADGWQAAERLFGHQIKVIGSLIRNVRPGEIQKVSNQILELGVFEGIEERLTTPTWVNIAPGVFELIFTIPMRVPPKVDFYDVPENIKITLEHASNISARFRFEERSSGLPTNDVPFSKINIGLESEL